MTDDTVRPRRSTAAWMPGQPQREEQISAMIDRLVLGLLPSEELMRRILRLKAAGWLNTEIAVELSVARETVEKRMHRHRTTLR